MNANSQIPSILITVEGGLIQTIISTKELNVIVVDYDAPENDDRGLESLITEWDAELCDSLQDSITGKLNNEEKYVKKYLVTNNL